jgi:putative membrane protein
MSPEDHTRIAAAIRKAEAKTAGEIYCVVAHSSDSYFIQAAFMVTTAMLVVSWIVALVIEQSWLNIRLPVFVGAQILSMASALAVLWAFPALRIHLVPRALRYRRASANAARQFLAKNIHLTTQRTGVLIFVSLAERYAEVVADAGINGKVTQGDWDGIVRGLIDHAGRDRLADGFVAAIDVVGTMLALHFPVSENDVNELDDHLVEI